MKSAAIAVVVLVLVALLLWRLDSGVFRRPGTGQTSPGKVAGETAPTTVSTDAEEVFRKAFWQHPGEEDRILHAERREWADAGGLRKWQWFIVVDASPALLKRLRDDNVFDLKRQATRPAFSHPPDWFRIPDTGVEFMTSAGGGFCLILDETGNRIHATDSGTGFRPGAPEPIRDSP